MVCIFLLVWLVINNFDWQFFLVCGGKEYKMEFSARVVEKVHLVGWVQHI